MRKWTLLTITAAFLSLMAVGAAPAQPSSPSLQQASTAQQQHTNALLRTQGVVGTAVGLTADSRPAVLVFTENSGVAGLPRTLDGVPVDVRVTGKIEAADHRPGHSASPSGGALKPTSRWPRPVPIGISTGNVNECAAGTIGGRVKDGAGAFYALSNNHVYARQNDASLGEKVLQPGRYDTGCGWSEGDVIGTLSNFVPIVFSTDANNEVDGAIALSDTTKLGRATPSDGYGTPSSATVTAQLNQRVQKYGRTTKLTKGSVVGINSTINVGYNKGTARFVNQITILGNKPFIRSGDSGSLAVTESGANPVGLGFAASANGYAFANPIGAVLSGLGVSIDGQ